MNAKPHKQHRWLEQLIGEWTFETEYVTEPGQPPSRFKGSERVRSLGGLWVVAEGQGEMPDGGTGTTIMTLGYDPQKQRYMGTFIGSMMAFLWVYDGALDTAEKVLTLDTEGPDFATKGKMAKYKDVIELRSHDYRMLTSQVLGDDGQWRQIMTTHYQRSK